MTLIKLFMCSVALACLLVGACVADESPSANTYSDPAVNELKSQVLKEKTTTSQSYKGQPWATSSLNESNKQAVSVAEIAAQAQAPVTSSAASDMMAKVDSFLKAGAKSGFYVVSVPDFVNATASDPNWVVVDVRAADQYSQGHIQNSMNIPLENLVSQLGMIPAGEKIAVCGSLDSDSALAVETLSVFGDREAYVLQGGIAAWQAANMPLVG